MLLSLTTTHSPATDLGFLLHKNPARPQRFDLNFGRAHVFYPQASDGRCTATLLLEVDPIALVRNRRGPGGDNFALHQYVNDRPYVASSFLSVAIAQVFGSALAGTSRERPALVDQPIPLHAHLPVVPCRGGEPLLRALFEPLGYALSIRRHPLDDRFPEWGEGPYYAVELSHTLPLRDLLRHLYVLIPVLDDEKHYWVDAAEVEKLLRHGEEWLRGHPQKEQIVSRYLRHRKHLARAALARLTEQEAPDADGAEESHAQEEEQVERKLSLNELRHQAVVDALLAAGAKTVLDLGCNTGRLLQRLLKERQFERIVGLDVSHRALDVAADRLHYDDLPDRQKQRLTLIHGSLSYRDKRLAGHDAAAVVEVIEHLDPPRLASFERVLFEFARPKLVLVTTPNVEYNALFETLPAGHLRHRDHRFEWTRAQFERWGASVAGRFHYDVRFAPIGPVDPTHGAPTQMAIFTTRQPAA